MLVKFNLKIGVGKGLSVNRGRLFLIAVNRERKNLFLVISAQKVIP